MGPRICSRVGNNNLIMKRREFVLKGGLASLALATSTSVLGNLSSFTASNETINLGIIGTGDRGGGLIPVINEIGNLNVAACSDILPFRLERGLELTHGKAIGYRDYRRILDNKDIDAVLIAIPFSEHSKMAIEALDAGKHVYAEKTLAKGYDGIEQLLNKSRSSKAILQTGHQYHSSRLYSHVVDEIKKGKIGNITAFDCQWNRNGNWRRPVPGPEMERLINWRMYREYSGGLVAELCSHQIDFANWVLNSRPKEVLGAGGIDYWKDGRETFDNVHLIYNYPGGVKAKFTCLTSNAKDDYQIKVLGDKGTITLGYTEAWFYPEGNTTKEVGNVDGVSGATIQWDQVKGIPIEMAHEDPSKQALIDFRDNITDNRIPESNAATGAETARCVQMALDALYSDGKAYWQI